jgi:hypothetical protein
VVFHKLKRLSANSVSKFATRRRTLHVATTPPSAVSSNLISRRCLSSSESPDTMDRRWSDSTSELLNLEQVTVGSFDSLQWQLAETMIIHWAEREHGVEGIKKCFAIIDRLVEEASYNREAKFTMAIYLIHAGA